MSLANSMITEKEVNELIDIVADEMGYENAMQLKARAYDFAKDRSNAHEFVYQHIALRYEQWVRQGGDMACSGGEDG